MASMCLAKIESTLGPSAALAPCVLIKAEMIKPATNKFFALIFDSFVSPASLNVTQL
jgi:hypothetical protein